MDSVKAALRAFKQIAGQAMRHAHFRSVLARFLRRYSTAAAKAPVLIWDLGNFPGIVGRNGLFATGLKARGERTHTVLCDGTPVACIQRGIEKPDALPDWQRACAGCYRTARATAEKYCLDHSAVGDYVEPETRAEFGRLSASIALPDMLGHEYLGTAVGRIAWSSLNRHMKGKLVADVDGLSAEEDQIFRAYFYAALVNVHAADQAMRKHSPRSVLTSHGVYVDYAPAMSIAFQRRIPAVSWSSAYSEGHHYFTMPRGANQLLLQGTSEGLWQQRAATALTSLEEQRLDAFLHHRYVRAGARDINVVSQPEEVGALRRRLGLREGRRVFCVFAHVNWDACFDMSSMLYPNANAWILDTMRRAFEIMDVNWIIRVHPGELTDGSVLSTGDIIKSTFPNIPPHVKVLWADSDINSYGLYQLIDGGVTIFGTPGIELTALGKPVVLAGQAHYGGKGFTLDSGSLSAYRQVLQRIASVEPLTAAQTALARRYAYWYFVQRHIPVRAIDLRQGHWGDLDLDRIDSLLPGRDAIMDSVCRTIVEGRDAILSTEILASTNA